MSNRTLTSLMATLAIFTLALSLATKATAQDAEPTQRLVINYPDAGIVVSGKGESAVTLNSPVHVQAFPLSPQVIKKHGSDALVSEDITIRGYPSYQLPLGKYELHYSMRVGGETKAAIETVVLRADSASNVQIDFSTAKTYIIGDSISLQQLEDAVGGLALVVKDLKAQVDALKAAPAK